MTRTTKPARPTFPVSDDYASACHRAETILEHYAKARGDSRGDWYALVIRAIADLSIIAEAEYAVACGEARAEGDYPPSRAGGAEYVADEGLALARGTLEDWRRAGDECEPLAGRLPPSIFQGSGG